MLRSLLAAVVLVSSTTAHAKALTCDRQQLQKALPRVEQSQDARERMRGTAALLLEACTGFPEAQQRELEAVARGPLEQLRGHATEAFIRPSQNETSSFCPGKPFVVLYAPTSERAARFDACKLGKRKLLSRDEWTAALAPEPAYVLDEVLRKAKVPAALARTLARHFAGPGLYDSLMKDPAAPRDPFAPERPGATCNQTNLDKGLATIAGATEVGPDHWMVLTATLLADECAGALPGSWTKLFNALPNVPFDSRRMILLAGLYLDEPNPELTRQLCPSGEFPKQAETPEARKAVYTACGFDKQGALTQDEWVKAEVPEAGVAVYAFLRRQQTPPEKARKLAVLLSGVGARERFEADEKQRGTTR